MFQWHARLPTRCFTKILHCFFVLLLFFLKRSVTLNVSIPFKRAINYLQEIKTKGKMLKSCQCLFMAINIFSGP